MKNCNSCEFCIAWWCDLYERFLDSDENIEDGDSDEELQ
nr:MAG TPA: hypothetical protein [Caudoviricetes sp.]